MMYDKQMIGKSQYADIHYVRNAVCWDKIASHYGINAGFDSVARKLVKMRLLSDAGKSMAVLFLDKMGTSFAKAYISHNPGALEDLCSMLK